MKRTIMRRFFVLAITIAMLVTYALPASIISLPGGGGSVGAATVYADGEIADEDWNFDSDTGELKGFKDGSNYDNPSDLVIPATIGGVAVKSIGNQAFQNSSSGSSKKIKNALTSITLPEGLETIGRQAFQTGVKMSGDPITVTFPASLKTLDYRAFYGWDRIGEVKFAENSQIEMIGQAAFQGCSVLEKITLPVGLKTIDVDAFRDTSLKSIDIPSSVETIGATAFALTLMREFTLPATVTSWSKTTTGADPTGTSVMFFRTAKTKEVSSSGYYSQGTLELTRVYDSTGQATPSNTGAVVNPQPVTIKFVDEEGETIKEPEEAVGAEYNTLKGVEGTYSTQYYLDEGNGDGHLYFNYETPFQETGKTNVYSNRVSSDENKDWAAALIGGNYFTAGNEYTFKAPKINGYTEPAETITKTITAEDHEVTFVYKAAQKYTLTAEGEGLTTDPEPGQVGEGADVTATIDVPAGKKIDTFTVNDEDHKADLVKKDGKYTYTFEMAGDTSVKVTYADLAKTNVLMTVSDQGLIAKTNDNKPMALCDVEVTDLDGDDKFTFDEALIAAHKQYNDEDGYSQSGGQVRTLWGKATTNALFFVNGQGIPNGVTADAVESGDHLTASINKDLTYYSDWISSFSESSMEIDQRQSAEIELKGHLGMAWDDETRKDVPLKGVQVGIWKNGAFEAISGAVTDENGKANVAFDEPGEYLLTASGTVKGTVTSYELMQFGTDVYGRIGSDSSMEVGYTDADYGNGPYPADEIKWIDYFEEADEDSDNEYAWEDLHYLKSNQILSDCPIIAPAMKVTVNEVILPFLSAMRVGAAPGYPITPEFNGEPGEYGFEMPDSVTTLAAAPTRSDAGAGSTITAKWTNQNTGNETSSKITGTFLNLSGFRKADTPSGTSFILEVEKGGKTQEYKFTSTVYSTMKGLDLSVNGNKVKYSPDFNANTKEYSAEVLDTVDKIKVKATPYGAEYNVKINGETAENGEAEVTLDKEVNQIPIVVQGEGMEATTYTLTVNKLPTAKLSFETTPEDAFVFVTDGNNDPIARDDNGAFVIAKGKDNNYTVTKPGYVAETGTVNIDSDTTKTVTLTAAKENEDIDPSIPSEFPNFRGNDTNMAIVDIKTPTSAEYTQLNWANREGGYSWPQILVGDYVVTATNTTLRMINKKTGETEKTATMVAPQQYTNVPMTYKDGVIYCQLNNATVQAFDAKSLKSLWVYRDPVGGQPQQSIVVEDGYLYTGFWKSDTADANFVCISVTDEDPSNETEAKAATWAVKRPGGYYWANPIIVGDYVVLGSENGTTAANDPADIIAIEKATGKVADKLSVRGDVRTAVAYDSETDRYYASTTAGDVVKFAFDKETGKFGEKATIDLGTSLGKCTPVVYKGVIYTGLGNFTAGTFVAVDAETMTEKYRLPMKTAKGQLQGSFVLSTAYEEETGYIYIYLTYNGQPGGVDMIKVKPDETEAENVISESLFDAEGYEQYCNCSLICDNDGNLYYKNDTGNVFSVGPVHTCLATLTAEGGEPEWNKEFLKARNDYDVTVAPGTQTVTFSFQPDEGSTVWINGKEYTENSYDVKVRDGVGQFVVTTKAGEDEKTYTVNITERSENAKLAALIVNESNSYGSAKAMTPAFDPDGKDFVVYKVGSSRSFENVWPDAADPDASIKVFPVSGVRTTGSDIDPETGEIKRTATSGVHGRYAVYFATGETTMKVKIEVTSAAGTTTQDYFVTMTKNANADTAEAQAYCDSMDPSNYAGDAKTAIAEAKAALQEAIDNGTAAEVTAALSAAMQAVNENETIEDLLNDLQKELEKAKADLEAAKQDVKDAQDAADAAQGDEEDLQELLNAAKAALEEAQAIANSKIDAAETSIAALTSALADEQAAKEELQGEIDKLKTELEQAKEDIAAAQQAATDTLADARKAAIAEIKKYASENYGNVLPSDLMAAELAALRAINDIRDAVTPEEINNAVTTAKTSIDGLVEAKKKADAAKKALAAKIKAAKNQKVAGFKAKALKGNKAKISWKKNAKVNGYQIFRSLKKKSGFKKITQIKKNSTVKFTNKKLKKGKNYFYKMRTFTKISGKTYYGKWTAVKKIKAK